MRALRHAAMVAIVAVGAAGFAIAFRGLLQLVFRALAGERDVVSVFEELPKAARILLPALGGLLAGAVGRFIREGQGVGDVMEAVALGRVRLSMGTTLKKSLGCWLAIALGGSLGREGPLIQFGGTLGSTVGGWFRAEEDEVRILMAAGTAAGFAAAYNTPLAALLFVLEIVAGVAALDAVVSAIVATALATAITRAVAGGGPIYGQRAFALIGASELVLYAVLGVAAALAARGFMRLLSLGEAAFEASKIPQPLRAALGGLVVGLVALETPEVTGNGYEPLNAMIDGRLPIGLVVWLLFAKSFTTTASVASGSPGGVFTPTLFIGAAIGLCLHHLAGPVFGPIGGPGGYALVGMAAASAATTHAPLMAAVLVFELSGDYAIVLPLLLATAIAAAGSRALGEESIYGAELKKRGVSWELTLSGRKVIEKSPG